MIEKILNGEYVANNEMDYDKVKNLLNWTIVNKINL